MSKIPVRAHTGGRAYGGAGPKGLRKKTLKFDRKSPKMKKIELTIKMCGILSEIVWQLFFPGHFTPQIARKRLSPQTPLGRLLGIRPTASARENRYFGHKSGSGAQNLDFFGSSVAESPCATFRSPENLADTASTGPQTRFFGILTENG